MTYEIAEVLYDDIDTDVETFDDLPTQVQADLTDWLNCEPNEDDKKRLLTLYVEGRFKAWDCPHCESKGDVMRVFCADVHEHEWGHFQGSRNQDFSYFGDRDKYTEEYIAAICDSCRCFG